MTEYQGIIERVRAATGADNALDMEVEIAAFRPDDLYASVRANSAGTKLIYTQHDGKEVTCWALDWTLNPTNRASAITVLTSALQSQEPK